MNPLGKLMFELRACMEVNRHFPFASWRLYKGLYSRGCHRKSPRRPLPGSPFGSTSIRPEVVLNAETFRVEQRGDHPISLSKWRFYSV